MLQALIIGLISLIKFKLRLKKCVVIENTENVELFEYKGKAYDRKKFIRLEAEYLYERDMKRKTLEKQLDEYESNLVKSKTPDLDAALIVTLPLLKLLPVSCPKTSIS